MKKIICALLMSVGLVQASDDFESFFKECASSKQLYRLPPKEQIAEIIEKKIDPHFIEKTQIDQKLGSQRKVKIGICLPFLQGFEDYKKYLKKGGMPDMMISKTVNMMQSQQKSVIEDIINASTPIEE